MSRAVERNAEEILTYLEIVHHKVQPGEASPRPR